MRHEIECALSAISAGRAAWLLAQYGVAAPEPAAFAAMTQIAPLWAWAGLHLLAALLMLAMLHWPWLDDVALFLMFVSWTTIAVVYLVTSARSPTVPLLLGYVALAGLLNVWHWLGEPRRRLA